MTEPIPGLTAPSPAPGADQTGRAGALREAAREFEAVFLAQILGQLNAGPGADQLFGDGPGQAVFQDLFNQELAKLISRSGGIGVADAVLQEMLKLQEVG